MNTTIQRNNSKYRIQLIQKATKQELEFKKYLEELGVKFNFQKGFLLPYHRICDFYIKKFRLIVEIDGGYHTLIKEKDAKKDLDWARFNTLRILNSEVDSGEYKVIFENYIRANNSWNK